MGVLSTFVLWCFCPFLLFTVCRCDHMMRMLIVHSCIMWSWDRTLYFWSIKIISHFWPFSPLWFWSLCLSSYCALVHFCFSLSTHVIAWRECWLSTLVAGDHGIVHLDFWSIKIFSHFWGFCPLWFWSFGSFVLFCFCPFLLFSVHPRHRMTRMLVVHTCSRWSWDRTPWFLEY